jgi:hypothetical protein
MRAGGYIGIGTGIGLALLLGSAVVPLRGQSAAPAFKFHHVHLNTLDSTKAIDFYATNFNAQRGLLGGKVPGACSSPTWTARITP